MVTHTEVEIRVERFKVYPLRVDFPGGHHVVVGGRLVSSTDGEKTTPHPDMPEYTHDMFPAPVVEWSDGLHPDVTVRIVRVKPYGLKDIGRVRAQTLLFTQRDRRVVADWIRGVA